MKKRFFLLTASMLHFAAMLMAQNLLDPRSQPKFVNPLPIPGAIDMRSGGSITIAVTQFEQDLGLVNPISKQALKTKVWGYSGQYPGPTILTRKGFPVTIRWENRLVGSTGVLPHLLSIDTSLDWALSGRMDYQKLGVPLVTHLHGGHTESASDGLPEAWFTPGFSLTGRDFVKQTYHYENSQEAATLWYHDHALGITRLNVYAGLAGFYLLTDDHESALQAGYQLPAAPYDIGLAIQDRQFTQDGQLSFQTLPSSLGGPENSIVPEFFGNIILVNGKAWPVLEVEPRPYRFRLLNGSDSRFYNLYLSSGQKFVQVGSDDGLLPLPVSQEKLLLGNGERKDVVIDFSDRSLWGKTIILENNAKTPFPKGRATDPQTTGRIMAFKIIKPLNTAIPVAKIPATLRPPVNRLQTSLPARKLILFETTDDYGRVTPLLGTVEEGKKGFFDPVTEIVKQGNTEVWEIYNLTADAHPIHLHMVTMQLVSRQKFHASIEMESGKPVNLKLTGQPVLPLADEAGWKDTYVTYPGEVTRVIAHFDLAGKYVWHCHILSHEDNEMMRPYLVEAAGIAKALATEDAGKQASSAQAIPNPFRQKVRLQFTLERGSNVAVNVYDSKGVFLQQAYNQQKEQGQVALEIDGGNWSSGAYFIEVIANGKRLAGVPVVKK